MNSSLSRKAILSVAGTFARFIANLVPAVMLVRLFSKNDYGTFAQIILISQTIAVIMSLGVNKSIYYFLPLNRNKRAILLQSHTILFIIGSVITIVLYLSRNSLGNIMNNQALADLVILICGITLFVLVNQNLSPTLFSLDKAELLSVVNVTYSFLFCLSMVLVLMYKGSLKAALVVILLLNIIEFMFLVGYSFTAPSSKEKIWGHFFLKKQLIYGLPLFLSEMLQQLSRRLDQFMISLFFLPAQFAIYTRGAMDLPLVNIITYPIVAGLLMPRFVEYLSGGDRDVEGFIKLWKSTIEKIALIIFPVVILLFTISGVFITFLYTDRYSESIPIFQVYLLIAFTNIAAYDVVLQASGHTRTILWITVFAMIFNTCLNYALIKTIGMLGPAIATVITIYLTTALYLYNIKNVLNVSFRDIMPWKKLGTIFIISLVTGLLCFPINYLNTPKLFTILTISSVYTICYLFQLNHFKLIQINELTSLVKRKFLGVSSKDIL